MEINKSSFELYTLIGGRSEELVYSGINIEGDKGTSLNKT